MRIMYINHYAGSVWHGMEYRPHYLARHWVRNGHEVVVVAASASHLRSKAPHVESVFTEELIDGIRYVWLKTPSYQGNGARRAINMASFVAQLYRNKRMLVRRFAPDAVIASSTYTLDIFPAASIARRCKAALIYEVHDLWPLSPMELGGMSPWHPFIMALQYGEDYACRHADLVISMLPFADAHLRTRGMDPDKFHYIPNGIELEEWENPAQSLPQAHRELTSRCRQRGRFMVGYAGTHGLANALAVLLEAAQRLQGAPVDFLLTGQGPEKESLRRQAEQRGLSNVHFLDPVPKSAIPELLEQMDVLFIGWKRHPLYRFGISPNKLMDYMAAGKPIIHAAETPNDCVREADCGLTVQPDDPGAVADAVARLVAMTPAERNSMGQRAKAYVRANYSNAALAQRFLSLMDIGGVSHA